MNCQRFDELADLHVGGEVEAGLGAELEAHAAACPRCSERLAGARALLATIQSALPAFRAADGFVRRTMTRVDVETRRTVAAAPAPAPERLTSRLFRYAALVAAGAMFALAGYGLLRRPSPARVRDGEARLASVGGQAQPVRKGARLALGDVVVTPEDGRAILDLAGGRVKALLQGGTVMRICDPRRGSVAEVERGHVFWRVTSEIGAPVIISPLAKVGAARGAISLHVEPHPRLQDGGGRFRGSVTFAAHEGSATVLLPGGRRTVVLRPRQVLTLVSGRRSPMTQPVAFGNVRQQIARQLARMGQQRAVLERRWVTFEASVPNTPAAEYARLFRTAAELRVRLDAMAQACQELARRRDLLLRYHSQGETIFRDRLPSVEH